MPPIPNRGKLVNRGPAGLLNKRPVEAGRKRPRKDEEVNGGETIGEQSIVRPERPQAKKRIADSLKGLIVKIDSLNPDPDNARVHPENNLESICESLKAYGQVKPIVVRKKGRIIVAGNGTYEAAKQLGWSEIAAVIVDMTDREAAGYGLADNRTAELAKWDFEVVARLESLLREQGDSPIGFTDDELSVMRGELWEEPPDDFPELDENIETEHVCPKCGYAFSGGEVRPKGSGAEDGEDDGENDSGDGEE